MSQQALEMAAERRRELALDTMRAARASELPVRQVLGAILVTIGHWIAGGTVEAQPQMRVTGERA